MGEVGASMLKALDSAKDLCALACDCLPENPCVNPGRALHISVPMACAGR